MAFPTTSVLTNFTGADEEPLSEGGNWSASTIRTNNATDDPCSRASNRIARPSNASAVGESVWAASFAADQEVFMTVPTLGVSGQDIDLYFRIQNEGGSSVAAYLLAYVIGTGWQFYRLSNITYTQIGATVSTQVLSAGDSMGASVLGTTLEAWYKAAAGSWTSLGSVTDSVVTGAGRIGVGITAGSSFTGDDFGGGAAVISVSGMGPRNILMLGVG